MDIKTGTWERALFAERDDRFPLVRQQEVAVLSRSGTALPVKQDWQNGRRAFPFHFFDLFVSFFGPTDAKNDSSGSAVNRLHATIPMCLRGGLQYFNICLPLVVVIATWTQKKCNIKQCQHSAVALTLEESALIPAMPKYNYICSRNRVLKSKNDSKIKFYRNGLLATLSENF